MPLFNFIPHRWASHCLLLAAIGLLCDLTLRAQPYGQADRGAPGDDMIQEYLRLETEKLEADFLGQARTAEDWEKLRPQFHREYLDMLGLWPLPEKTPLHATITRTLDRGDYQVDALHYQSRPGLYVTANLYRPAQVSPGEKLPAVFYVCGHSSRGRNGNKTAYQSHGIWLARHGYICLMVDTLQLGEIGGIHHGTYREGRWWWLSRGYTPAGVECWNGIRGIDYLVSRPDVDAGRIGVTGISGGGAATFWIAAADERVKVAVPVSGMADLVSYVPNRVVNGHCDCMFLYNTYQWPWTRIAALIAPRPLLFVNSDQDAIFPMDANERIINRLERLYSLFGAGDRVDSLVSIGGHAYRQDIRQGAYRFLNTYLKNDPQPVSDSESDLVRGNNDPDHPIPPSQLRAFPQDSDIPQDAINCRADQEFVPLAPTRLPQPDEFETWRNQIRAKLRSASFHHFPETIPAARLMDRDASGVMRLATEGPVQVKLKPVPAATPTPERIWILISGSRIDQAPTSWISQFTRQKDQIFVCEPRGIGSGDWTRKNPPNYVARSHYLLGRTPDSGRIWDIVAVAHYLLQTNLDEVPIYLAGEGSSAVLAVYAGLLEPKIGGFFLRHPPASHMNDAAPGLLNVLRVLDIPIATGLLAPRPVSLMPGPTAWPGETASVFRLAGALDKFSME